MINYNKNKLINECLEKYYETFALTLDTADYVPEKFNKRILAYIFKNMKRQFKKVDREDKRNQRELLRKVRAKVKAQKACVKAGKAEGKRANRELKRKARAEAKAKKKSNSEVKENE